MSFTLPTKQLEAFYTLATECSFSRAAYKLHISQSALSQRIIKLEKLLNRKLFMRSHNNTSLTDSGTRLLAYYRIKQNLEEELLSDFNDSNSQTIAGSIIISSFSSITRSVIMPSLSKLMVDNPAVQIDLRIKDLNELHGLIDRSESDFIISQKQFNRLDFENIFLGYEMNVLIKPAEQFNREHIILDHNIDDHFTESFLKRNKASYRTPIKRSFVDDIYGIIDGVRLGFGIGVVPLHMLKDISKIQIEDQYKPLKTPCYLQFKRSNITSKLHKEVIESLTKNFKQYIS